jgi:thiol-disulfide isomerase/thioredoxin
MNMKKSIAKRSIVAAISVMAATGMARADTESGPLSTHKLAALDGTTTTLANYRGEVLVVNFWASWCAPCRKELPLLDQWNSAWAGRGARVIAISIDSDAKKAKQFVEEMKLTLPVMHDGPDGLARTLDIPSVPFTLLIDRDGKVIGEVRGSTESEIAALQRKVETILDARGVAPVQEAGVAGGSR